MHLTEEEQGMLAGLHGKAIQDAIQFQIEVGSFFGAKRLVPITNAHVMADIELIGDGGMNLLQEMQKQGARCSVPTTSNARCMHFHSHPDMQPNTCALNKEHKIINDMRSFGVNTTDTCINYQTVYQPKLGEHVAWGDTGTVIYANSVFGARTNFEAGKSSFAAALTGRTPAYGFHLDECRKGSIHVKIEANLNDLSDWGAIGKIVGDPHQDYLAVPVFEAKNLNSSTHSDALKHLGASLASYGSMGMFHFVGITPEAKTLEAAFNGNKATSEITITNKDLKAVYESYRYINGAKNIVVFSGPQLSLFEIQTLVTLFDGRHVAKDMTCVITTNRAVYSDAKQMGYVSILEKAGVTILQGVCFYILQDLTEIRIKNQWANLISNSAKIVNTITAHRFNTILRRTSDCVDIACTGELK